VRLLIFFSVLFLLVPAGAVVLLRSCLWRRLLILARLLERTRRRRLPLLALLRARGRRNLAVLLWRRSLALFALGRPLLLGRRRVLPFLLLARRLPLLRRRNIAALLPRREVWTVAV